MTTAPSDTTNLVKTPPRPRWFKAAVAAVVLLAIATLAYASYLASRESTDDAFLDAHIVSIAPSVAGHVVNVPIADNQEVKENDLLVEIDPSTYQADLAQRAAAHGNADSAVEAAVAQLANARAHLLALGAALDQAKADARAAQAEEVRTAADLKRNANMLRTGAISQQEFDQAKASAAVAEANYDAGVKRIVGAEAQEEEARTSVPSAEANVASARAASTQAAAAEKSANIDLDNTKIYAPTAGRVTRKAVDVGDYVQVGQSLLVLVPSDLWVTANFKENQLARMRPGQQVDVEIDAEDGRVYRAHVDSIQAGSGARFSLFPPENATGNYVKIVQRVPVKIVFDEPLDSAFTLGPGESVMPVVHTGWIRISGVTVVLVVLVAAAAIAGLNRLSRRVAKA